MKRVQQEEPEAATRSEKKLHIEPVTTDRLGDAVRAACRRGTGGELSNQPLLIYAHDYNSETDQTYAYWPANEVLGVRVMKDLESPMVECEEGDYNTLLVALVDLADGGHFHDVDSVEALGTIRIVFEEGREATPNSVWRSQLHPHLFQSEVHYD
jgi:hypothetical protein